MVIVVPQVSKELLKCSKVAKGMCAKQLVRYFTIEDNKFKYKETPNAPKFKKELPLDGCVIKLEKLEGGGALGWTERDKNYRVVIYLTSRGNKPLFHYS